MGERIKRTRDELLATGKPWTAKELESLAQWYFGAPLHLETLRVYNGTAQYRVKELYNSYHGYGWLHSTSSIEGYDYSREFWEYVIGERYCGGISHQSYGQTRHAATEQERLESLAASVRSTSTATSDATQQRQAQGPSTIELSTGSGDIGA